jgi:hypothetical protein
VTNYFRLEECGNFGAGLIDERSKSVPVDQPTLEGRRLHDCPRSNEANVTLGASNPQEGRHSDLDQHDSPELRG